MTLLNRKEMFPREPNIFAYYLDLMIQTFGEHEFYEGIFALLADLEEGQCGVETAYFTYPALLLAKGIQSKQFVHSKGVPENGWSEAATPEERRLIAEALENAGYKLIIPPWFNDDYTPKKGYFDYLSRVV